MTDKNICKALINGVDLCGKKECIGKHCQIIVQYRNEQTQREIRCNVINCKKNHCSKLIRTSEATNANCNIINCNRYHCEEYTSTQYSGKLCCGVVDCIGSHCQDVLSIYNDRIKICGVAGCIGGHCQEVKSNFNDYIIMCGVVGCIGGHCRQKIFFSSLFDCKIDFCSQLNCSGNHCRKRIIYSRLNGLEEQCGVQNCVKHRFDGIFLYRYLESLQRKQCLLYLIEYSILDKLPNDIIKIIFKLL
jgi:hypothetical protein